MLFTGKWAYNWGAFKLGGGGRLKKKQLFMVACARHSGIGEGAKRTKLKKTLVFLMLYFSLSECL